MNIYFKCNFTFSVVRYVKLTFWQQKLVVQLGYHNQREYKILSQFYLLPILTTYPSRFYLKL
jgi:hypothetical protein